MKHAGLATLLAATATLATASLPACGERIIIVQAPPAPVTSATTTSANAQPLPLATGTATADPGEWGIRDRTSEEELAATVAKVVAMPNDSDLRARVSRRGLSVVNVAWEDTGRSVGSSVGPNISDLSLQVRTRDARGGFGGAVMPVVRFPNFSDRTGDVPSDKFFVRVGNEKAGTLASVPLRDVLQNLRSFVSMPSSIQGSGNLLAGRDSHFLVSAQAVFLPIPKTGKAEFNPVLFNYQSSVGAPAVLTLLVTRQGTSVSVIENRPEDSTAAGWGQELYFNNLGQRAAFTAERKSDVAQRIAAQGGPKTEDDKSALAKGADVLFLVQVPLVHAQPRRAWGPPMLGSGSGGMAPSSAAPATGAAQAESADRRSDVEQAVLGHGPNLGPYNEGRGLRLERDTRFPVRITVQFYKATSNGVVSDTDLDSISRSIGSVYEHAEFVGSLVLPEGDPRRPTAWQRVPREWFPW
jgi:hypothetical protein